jgi:hypothetical protein
MKQTIFLIISIIVFIIVCFSEEIIDALIKWYMDYKKKRKILLEKRKEKHCKAMHNIDWPRR